MRPKLGLYSITYAGMWYDGPALSIKDFIGKSKELGFEGVELDNRAPHAVPYLLSEDDRKDIVDHLARQEMTLSAIAANNDFSSPVTEHREANIQMVVDLIRLCKDLGAPILRIFTAWEGSSRRDGMATYDVARRSYELAFPDTPEMERWRYCLECFRTVAKFAEDAGIILALQNHPPIVRNSQDCLAMANEVGSPNFCFSFDISGERLWQDTDWVLAAARSLGDRWVHSHMSGLFQRNPDGTLSPIPLGRPRGPKDGSMTWNYEAWVQAMFAVGYRGYVNYEACTPLHLPNGRLIPMEQVQENVEAARDYLLSLFHKYEKPEIV